MYHIYHTFNILSLSGLVLFYPETPPCSFLPQLNIYISNGKITDDPCSTKKDLNVANGYLYECIILGEILKLWPK